jgi:hypothetical protein
MVVLLVVGIGFVQNYTNIPFEKLWELTPQSGIATEPTPDIGGGYGDGDLLHDAHIFTSGSTYDLSEIACLIGKAIYSDYIKYGDKGSRSNDALNGGFDYINSLPASDANEYLIDAAFFNYSSTTQFKDNEIMSFDPKCHICRHQPYPVPPPALLITDLDEACINLQLRDRNVSSNKFCFDPFATQYEEGRFGNSNCFDSCPPNPAGSSPTWCDFCDDNSIKFCPGPGGEDKIFWGAEKDTDNAQWNITDKNFKEYTGDLLTNNRQYMYAVFWNQKNARYDVIFPMVPTTTTLPAGTEWNYIWQVLADKYNYRRNGLGIHYWQVRTMADFIFKPTNNINIYNGLMENIYQNGLSGCCKDSKVFFEPCTTWAQCLQGIKGPVEKYDCPAEAGNDGKLLDFFREQPIQLLINATDATTGKKVDINSKNGELLGGKTYRVIIKNWAQWYHKFAYAGQECYKYYDRSITILQLD